jgi:hypothetical protein
MYSFLISYYIHVQKKKIPEYLVSFPLFDAFCAWISQIL